MTKTIFKLLAINALGLLFAFPSRSQTLGNPADLPFEIRLEEATQDELPGLHSFAFAKWDDWWVAIGGRINGLHGFFVATGFPEDKANVYVRLLNPETGEQHQFEVANLNIPFPDALKATNPQYSQDGNLLYIVGGYGKSQSAGGFVTFPVLTAVDLPALVSKMLAGANPSSAFQQIEVESLRVCGGEMDKLGDHFYLVGGHDFSGLYNQNGPPQFTQKYTNEIRRFRIERTPTSLAIADFSAHRDEANLHRRDFTLAPVVRPDGTPALALYGGVFRVGADLPFYNPIYISEADIFDMDAAYEQIFAQYTCPVVPIFDSLDGSMYSIFFAGLSVHTFENGQLKYDEKVPFVKDITCLRRRADGSNLEFVLPQRFDEFLGTNMIFVPSENVPHFSNEVLKLRQMNGETFAGWLFGGIKAEIPNLTPSSASKRLFKVFVTLKSPSSGSDEAVKSPVLLKISPNPFADNASLRIEFSEKIERIAICHADGRLVSHLSAPASCNSGNVELLLNKLPSGFYFLKIWEDGQTPQVLKLLKK